MTSDQNQAVFQKACVIGAGVMGAQISAHLANAGVPVLLLDRKDQKEPNVFAKKGLESALSIKPAAFFTKAFAARIQIGNLDDDLDKIKDCDLVLEAVSENIDIKKSLFHKLESIISKKAIVASNTSGISIHDMTHDLKEDFQERFLVAHFFNPPRYLHLLELVKGKYTKPEVYKKMAFFGEKYLGKGIVEAKDTPNFIANRIGVFGILKTIQLMQERGFQIDEIDAIFGPILGRPKSAIFRTADVVGLDTLIHVSENCFQKLLKDPQRGIFQVPNFMTQMIQYGWLGQKSGCGFYQKTGSEIFVLDYQTLTHRPTQKIRFDILGQAKSLESLQERMLLISKSEDRVGQLVKDTLTAIGEYALSCIPEIAQDANEIDKAMRWGFGWEMGPIETLALLKPKKVTFSPLKKEPKVIKDTFATSMIDQGDGVLQCAFHTKMNAIDGDVISDIHYALDLCDSGQFGALILANEGQNFSVGANLLLIYMAAQGQQWDEIGKMITQFQQLGMRLRYGPTPTVSAPFQMTFGGGLEISMWCNHSMASAELYAGLVEVGVGVIPAGGGTTELLLRSLEGAVDDPSFVPDALIRRAFETIAMAKVSSSAEEAKDLLYMRKSDGICMNADHLIACAKTQALCMMKNGFRPPLKRQVRLPGKGAYATFDTVLRSLKEGHQISEHDYTVSKKLAFILSGGDTSAKVYTSEEKLLELEKEAFLSLCGEAKTQERIAYMLQNGKPLRN